MASIVPVPMKYAGVRFRSTLEADWAATLDVLGLDWQYEPEAIRLPSGELYRPDFYLPQITTWLEVKGPLGERLHKTAEMAEAFMHSPNCTGQRSSLPCCDSAWWYPWRLVVIGEASVRGEITFRLGNEESNGADLGKCSECGSWFFYGIERSFACRSCGAHDGDHHLAAADPAPFARAPRNEG